MRRLILVFGVGCWVGGCGDDGDPASETGSTSSPSETDATSSSPTTDDTTEDPSSGSTSMPATTGATESTGGSSTAGTGTPECIEDEAPAGPEVTFTLRNDGTEPVFVASALDCSEAFVRLDLIGDVTGRWPIDVCAPTCSSIVAGECTCPDDACVAPRFLRLEPGAIQEVVWNGELWSDAEVSAECNACDVAPDCLLGISAPAQTYLITSTATTMLTDCVDEEGQPSCTCPGGAQTCFIEGIAADPTELPVQVQLAYPDTTTLDLVFE